MAKNPSNPFVENFNFSIDLNGVVSFLNKPRPFLSYGTESYDLSLTGKFDSAPLITPEKKLQYNAAWWPDKCKEELAKQLSDTDRLNTSQGAVLKSVGFIPEYNITPEDPVVYAGKSIKKAGYYLDKEIYYKRYGEWYTGKFSNNVSDNFRVTTYQPMAVTLARRLRMPPNQAYPCFGCIPVGFMGSANELNDTPSYGGGINDLKFGKRISSVGEIDEDVGLGNLRISWLDSSNRPIPSPMYNDPYWSTVSIFKRAMLNDYWSNNLQGGQWPSETLTPEDRDLEGIINPFDLTDTYYKIALASNYLSSKYALFDTFMSFFSKPFKNPFNTPTRGYCQKIYDANKKAYDDNPYSLVISIGNFFYDPFGEQWTWKFDIDPDTGFPKKTGKRKGLKLVPDDRSSYINPDGLPTEYTDEEAPVYDWDGTNSVSYYTYIEYNRFPDFDYNAMFLSRNDKQTTLTLSGSLNLDYTIN